MDKLPKGLQHHLDYYMTEYTLRNFSITGGEITTISIRFHTDSHAAQGDISKEVSGQYNQYYRPKSSAVLSRDKQRQEAWVQRKGFDSALYSEESFNDRSCATVKTPITSGTNKTMPCDSVSNAEMNINASCFYPMNSTPGLNESSGRCTVDTECVQILDKECNTDIIQSLDKTCQIVPAAKCTTAVQVQDNTSSVLVQTNQPQISKHRVQTVPVITTSSSTITDSLYIEHAACQYEQQNCIGNISVQTDPAESKHVQTEPPPILSKLLQATPFRNQYAQTLTKKQMKLEKAQEMSSKAVTVHQDSDTAQISEKCNNNSDQHVDNPQPEGACMMENVPIAQPDVPENVSLQDILDLLIKINNR